MKNTFLNQVGLFFKGVGMGAANVIPGVSGGTIALITDVFEELINSVKSFDVLAIKLLLKGQFKSFSAHVNLPFLVVIFLGIAFSIVSIARLLEFLFTNYPVQVWAYFFGLILASVYFVGKTVEKWHIPTIISFVVGTAIAVSITFMNPATENENFLYLVICGVVAICSMILPGLSGSFVLILMGNYQLVAIEAINDLRLDILLPVMIGAVAGLIAFSHLLSWVYKKFKDQTVSLLTGFILGSLGILWPWKKEIYKLNSTGGIAVKDDGEKVIQGYERYIPDTMNQEVFIAMVLAVLGIVSIWLVENYAMKKSKTGVS